MSVIEHIEKRKKLLTDNSVRERLRQSDFETMLAAVKENGFAIAYASLELKQNHNIALCAVKEYGWAINYLCQFPKLTGDRHIMIAAAESYGNALCWASEKLKADREVVLCALKNDGMALGHASSKLKKDPEIVFAAVKNNESALQYADEELQTLMLNFLRMKQASKGIRKYMEDSRKSINLMHMSTHIPAISLATVLVHRC